MADMRRRGPEPPPGTPQIQHKPGLANEMLRELAPLLAEEGIDVHNIDVPDLETLQAAMNRAVERANMARFTPVGKAREHAVTTLRLVVEAVTEDDTTLAAVILESVPPELPTAPQPPSSRVTPRSKRPPTPNRSSPAPHPWCPCPTSSSAPSLGANIAAISPCTARSGLPVQKSSWPTASSAVARRIQRRRCREHPGSAGLDAARCAPETPGQARRRIRRWCGSGCATSPHQCHRSPPRAVRPGHTPPVRGSRDGHGRDIRRTSPVSGTTSPPARPTSAI